MATPQDLLNANANLATLDAVVTSTAETTTDRLGQQKLTLSGFEDRATAAIESTGWFVVGEFSAGFTYTARNQVGRDSSGNMWSYNGPFTAGSFVVSAGTVPSAPNYTNRGDATLRSNLAAADSDVLIAGMEAQELVARTKVVASLKQLRRVAGVVQPFESLVSGSGFGGGDAIFYPDMSETLHTGGTVWAAAAVDAWDGTQGDLPTLLNYAGTVSGCYVRQGVVKLAPEMFGAVPLVDCTLSLLKMVSAANEDYQPFEFALDEYIGYMDLSRINKVEINSRSTFKLPNNSSSNYAIKYQKTGGSIFITGIKTDGNKTNQTSFTCDGIFIKDAEHVVLNCVESDRFSRNGIDVEYCNNVTLINLKGDDNGFATTKGDPRNVKASGINLYMCNNVNSFGGEYNENSYLGFRASGEEEIILNAPDWSDSTAISLGSNVIPSGRGGLYAACQTAGTTGATEPTWPTTEGDTVVDGTVTWQMKSPLAKNIAISGNMTAHRNGGDFGGNEWGIGISIASYDGISINDAKAYDNEGNNIDLNRCWNGSVFNCYGLRSVKSHGINPDYTQDRLGLAGGNITIRGGGYKDNYLNGILVQGAYKGSTTPQYSGVRILDVELEDNRGAGIAAETFNDVEISGNTLRNNGATSQIAILEAGTVGRKATDVWGDLVIANNKFYDDRSTKVLYNIYFGVYTNASNPRYNRMVCEMPKVNFNKFGDYQTRAIKSDAAQVGGVDNYNNMQYLGNTGDGSGIVNVITLSRIISGYVDLTNMEYATVVSSGPATITGFTQARNGDRKTLYFAATGIEIADADTPAGAGGNIQLISNGIITPAIGDVIEFILMSGRWQEI